MTTDQETRALTQLDLLRRRAATGDQAAFDTTLATIEQEELWRHLAPEGGLCFVRPEDFRATLQDHLGTQQADMLADRKSNRAESALAVAQGYAAAGQQEHLAAALALIEDEQLHRNLADANGLPFVTHADFLATFHREFPAGATPPTTPHTTPAAALATVPPVADATRGDAAYDDDAYDDDDDADDAYDDDDCIPVPTRVSHGTGHDFYRAGQ